MNVLAIDIGNTHSVLGYFNNNTLEHSWRLESDSERTVDEYALQLLSLLETAGVKRGAVESIAICCVVPSLQRVFSKLAEKYFSIKALVVGLNVSPGVEVLIDEPSSLGADRIVNAVSVKQFYKLPAVVVDFGTATTFDVIDDSGRYIGGVIAPGLVSAAKLLSSRAALLPSVELQAPKTVIGKNTSHSMRSGLVFGYAAMVDGLLAKICAELAAQPKVYATGGLSNFMIDFSTRIDEYSPDLTLKGLNFLATESAKN